MRYSLMSALLLGALLAAAPGARAAGNAAAASPYGQPRTQGYTSFDNPYAPGGVYDPYRGNHPLTSSRQSDTRSKQAKSSRIDSLSSDSVGGPGNSLGSSTLAGGSGCVGGRLGASSGAAGSAGTSRAKTAAALPGSYARLSKCGNSAQLGASYSNGVNGSMGMKGEAGAAAAGATSLGQANNLQDRQYSKLQQLPH